MQTTLNNIKQQQKDRDFEKRATRNNSIKLLLECSDKSINILDEINKIINTNTLTDKSKVQKIRVLFAQNKQEYDNLYAGKFEQWVILHNGVQKGLGAIKITNFAK